MPTINIDSQKRVEMIDISDAVRHALDASGKSDGLIHLFTPHTTAAITINENADPDVVRDLIASLNALIPFDGDYRHLEGNSAAHLKSSLVGCSETIPFANGRMQLGTWQGIYFCEFDGPRRRQVQIKVLPG